MVHNINHILLCITHVDVYYVYHSTLRVVQCVLKVSTMYQKKEVQILDLCTNKKRIAI